MGFFLMYSLTNKLKIRGLALAFWLLAVSWSGLHHAQAEPLSVTLATGDNYPPYTALDLPHGGFATRVVERALDLGGVFVKDLQWLPWKRCMEAARNHQIDGTFPWSKSDERQKTFLYGEPIFKTLEYAWFRTKDARQVNGKMDFQGMRLCKPLGYVDLGMVKEMRDERLVRFETPPRHGNLFSHAQCRPCRCCPGHRG